MEWGTNGSFPWLWLLRVDSNRLVGSLPSESWGMGAFPTLRYLRLDFNQLKGSIPVHLWSKATLQYFAAAGNSFTGMLPQVLGANLTVLDLSSPRPGGKLAGPLPVQLPTNISVLLLSNHSFNGTLPPAWSSSSLALLSVGGNTYAQA